RNRQATLYGGPVNDGELTLVMRTAMPRPDVKKVFGDIYVATDHQTIEAILKDPAAPSDIRLYLGRAQWLNDQLRAEVAEGSWYMVPARSDLVFEPDLTGLWRKLAERAQLQEVRLNWPTRSMRFLTPASLETGSVEMTQLER